MNPEAIESKAKRQQIDAMQTLLEAIKGWREVESTSRDPERKSFAAAKIRELLFEVATTAASMGITCGPDGTFIPIPQSWPYAEEPRALPHYRPGW